MQPGKLFVFVILLASFILGACAPNASKSTAMDDPTETMMENTAVPMVEKPTEAIVKETAEPMMAMTETPEAMHATPAGTGMMEASTPGSMTEMPAWFSASLTDVASSEMFTISDYQGKVVLVELMAQWCSTCLRQQKQVVELHKQLGMDTDLVTIALDIDPNEDAKTLKAYAASKGFDWVYAVAPPDVSREIGNLYGAQYLNPPSAPMLLINRKGEVMPLPFGVKSAEELKALIQPMLAEGM